jgi:N-acetylmuramoyl-L-alanine amidase
MKRKRNRTSTHVVRLLLALLMIAMLPILVILLTHGFDAQNGGETVTLTLAPTAETAQPSAYGSLSPSVALPSGSPGAAPSVTPTVEPTPEPSPTVDSLPLAGIVIGLDPGHQLHSNSDLEPASPGSQDMKKKVSSGTQGVQSRVPEHEVNLAVGLLLRDLLEQAGATVYITRTTADVDISNIERAQFFNDHMVDLGVRLHCNGTEDSSVTGAFMLVPSSEDYPFYEENIRAAQLILEAYGDATGIGIKKGITYRSDQTGFNWCERPVVNIEMGHMSNPEEDMKLVDPEFQMKMAEGIFNGIVAYFTQGRD